MNKSLDSRKYNSRLALGLFGVYGVVYLAFVLVNGFAPAAVEWKPAQGVNLAVWWGLGLIALAFLEAIIYGYYCKPESTDANELPKYERSGDVGKNSAMTRENLSGKDLPP